jgi:general secretion pathway protein M
VTASLSPPMRRLLAVSLLIGIAWLLWSGVASPIIASHAEATATIERFETALSRERASERDIAALRASLVELKKSEASIPGFIEGANESIAAAQLQSRIKTAVEAVKGEMRSTQILPARDDGKYRRIAVRGQMLLTTAGLQRVLHDLESASPYLFLDNVDIKVRPQQRNRDTAVQEPTLEVRFDVAGFMRRPT